MLSSLADHYGFDVEASFTKLKKKHKHAILYGSASIHVYTIKKEDINKRFRDIIPNCDLTGYVFTWEVGKRVYKQNGVFQIETLHQMERRVGQ